jgi:hypothetical protein
MNDIDRLEPNPRVRRIEHRNAARSADCTRVSDGSPKGARQAKRRLDGNAATARSRHCRETHLESVKEQGGNVRAANALATVQGSYPASIPEGFGYTVFLYSVLHIKVKEANHDRSQHVRCPG